MADISGKITRRSIKAKKKAAIKTIKAQAKEKIKQVKLEYAQNPEREKAKKLEREARKERRIQKANARLAYNSRQIRQYSLAEDLVNSISHGIGAGLSVAAIVILVLRAIYHSASPDDVGINVFCFSFFTGSMFVMYLFSCLYHAIPSNRARRIFSIFTHDTIYLLIAGSYTPLVLMNIEGKLGMVIMILVWSLCALMIVLYSIFGARLRSFSVFTYVLFGWLICAIFSFFPQGRQTLTELTRVMLVAAGIVYSIGGLFFVFRRFKWTHTIFHIFVLAGSILHFFAMYYMLA